jgi:hypothetical protein
VETKALEFERRSNLDQQELLLTVAKTAERKMQRKQESSKICRIYAAGVDTRGIFLPRQIGPVFLIALAPCQNTAVSFPLALHP